MRLSSQTKFISAKLIEVHLIVNRLKEMTLKVLLYVIHLPENLNQLFDWQLGQPRKRQNLRSTNNHAWQEKNSCTSIISIIIIITQIVNDNLIRCTLQLIISDRYILPHIPMNWKHIKPSKIYTQRSKSHTHVMADIFKLIFTSHVDILNGWRFSKRFVYE